MSILPCVKTPTHSAHYSMPVLDCTHAEFYVDGERDGPHGRARPRQGAQPQPPQNHRAPGRADPLEQGQTEAA